MRSKRCEDDHEMVRPAPSRSDEAGPRRPRLTVALICSELYRQWSELVHGDRSMAAGGHGGHGLRLIWCLLFGVVRALPGPVYVNCEFRA